MVLSLAYLSLGRDQAKALAIAGRGVYYYIWGSNGSLKGLHFINIVDNAAWCLLLRKCLQLSIWGISFDVQTRQKLTSQFYKTCFGCTEVRIYFLRKLSTEP